MAIGKSCRLAQPWVPRNLYKGEHNVRVWLADSEDRELSNKGFFMNRGTMNEKEKQHPERKGLHVST